MDHMPTDAPSSATEATPRRGSVGSFRLLTARLKRQVPPATPSPPPPAPPPPPVPPKSPEPEAPPKAEVLSVPTAPAPAAAPHGPLPGEAATALLDIIWGAVDLPPQERSMVCDTLLILLPLLPGRDLVLLAERVAAMEAPPALLAAQLLRDPRPEIGGVLLERSSHLETGELLAACRAAHPDRLRHVARRRVVPLAVADHIVQSGDLLSHLALLRNAGAEISFASFLALSRMAGERPALQAPLALRGDLPLAAALELLWHLPPELRRVLMARLISDSATLGRILALAQACGGAAAPVAIPPPADVEAGLAPLLAGRQGEAVQNLARLAGIAEATVARIFSDDKGEALVVLLKALGLGRARFDAVLDQIRAGTGLLRDDRPQEELKAVFDALSFTKARVMLIYWDWFTRKAGPYVPDDRGSTC